jgi:hypothetical protein
MTRAFRDYGVQAYGRGVVVFFFSFGFLVHAWRTIHPISYITDLYSFPYIASRSTQSKASFSMIFLSPLMVFLSPQRDVLLTKI